MSYFLRKLEKTHLGNYTIENKCELFGSFSLIIQIFLGIATFCVLIIKRFSEKKNKRPWIIWFFDVFKQIISSLILHSINLLASVILTNKKEEDSCIWYLVTVLMGCLFGANLSYLLMNFIKYVSKGLNFKILLVEKYFLENKVDQKTNYKLLKGIYAVQILVWIFVTIIWKISLIIILRVFKSFFMKVGGFLLSPFKNGNVRLVMVLIVFPFIFNGLYYWISDNILKLNIDKTEKNDPELKVLKDDQVFNNTDN